METKIETANRRQANLLMKKEIRKRFPQISKVNITYDSYAGGDSLNVRYWSPEKIEDVAWYVKEFEYGTFDGREDLYHYNNEKEIILGGMIIPQVKYAFTKHIKE